ncbi:DegT/DnrJ/EryC1/StrS family aminotransferase [Desulfovibrio sp. 86]|uniref:DegT/DnrJ/EryC1/StrS aminotransferase n=1 Tax=uncultured Desulfovibrio sp. TaxID=167968 RepID=A0A212L471_9BACT|nr:DegT/DnrJ/EryC1/StrS family aminotransferase [Desulfovibrio sp. 86]SCM72267.1 DegT/DnrJ/EryC1/StrS aminotransferase [uncultured Desulfovibrio sp.]VZH33401.1 DegT/DnrJ/EryC1/StrS aminotransferase [Desulfovibrio sp. 86]
MSMRLSRSIVGEAEARAVSRVLLEDGYLGMGNEVRLFEEEVAQYLGVRPDQVITTNTGTAALHLAVDAVAAQCSVPGKPEVLVPSLTFVASFQAISAAGCVPVACDVLTETGTLDLADAEKRLTPNTIALMYVDYASNPWRLDEVYDFARRKGLRVVEDAAHAFGCKHDGRKIGSFGDMVCFSFDGIKNITCGEGGCLVAFDAEAGRLASDARLLSVEDDAQKRFAGARSWDPDVKRQGWRYHMSNIMAAIGRVQLSRLDAEFIPARRALAARYAERLSGVPGVALLRTDPRDFVVPHIMPVRVLDGRKDAVKEALAAQGLPTGVHYKPNHLLSYFGHGESLPATEQLYAELVTLPMHPGLTVEDVDAVCAGIVGAVKR